MGIYTFIMGYRGGIYISQVLAKDLDAAKSIWADTLVVNEIKYFGLAMQKELKKEIKDDESIPIKNTKNVWINLYSVKGGLIIVHIIKTSK